MRKKAIGIMFIVCFGSPGLLWLLLGKNISIPEIAYRSMGVGTVILYLPVIFLLSGFENVKMDAGMIIKFTYGIISLCIGAFLTITLSWWYILVSVFAFVFLYLLSVDNYASR